MSRMDEYRRTKTGPGSLAMFGIGAFILGLITLAGGYEIIALLSFIAAPLLLIGAGIAKVVQIGVRSAKD